MDKPFLLPLSVQHVNRPSDETRFNYDGYTINVTLQHSIRYLKELIWINSQDFKLTPLFTSITYNGNRLDDSQTLCDILNTPEPPLRVHGFVLTIDYTLFNSPSIPHRDPVPDFFDVNIITSGARIIRRRETLTTAVNSIKEEVALTLNFEVSDFNLKYTQTEEIVDNKTVAQVIKLDVPPFKPVEFAVEMVSIRKLVLIESDVPSLQQNSLFEVNNLTKLVDFKMQCIERIDRDSVSRTFLDQVKIYSQGRLLGESLHQRRLLLLVEETNNVAKVKLEISPNVSGGGGLFSREFWRDLRSPHRFDFLPNNGGHSLPNATPTGFTATGEVQEVFRNVQGATQLVDIDHGSLQLYEIQFAGETVTLNTSQCILVDRPDGKYVMVSPQGMHKLQSRLPVDRARVEYVRQRNQSPEEQNGPNQNQEQPEHQRQHQNHQNHQNHQHQHQHGHQRRGWPILTMVRRVFFDRPLLGIGQLVKLFLLFQVLGLNSILADVSDSVMLLLMASIFVLGVLFNGEEVGQRVRVLTDGLAPTPLVRGIRKCADFSIKIGQAVTGVVNNVKHQFINRAIRKRRYEFELTLAMSSKPVDKRKILQWHIDRKISDICIFWASFEPLIYTMMIEELESFQLKEQEELIKYIDQHFTGEQYDEFSRQQAQIQQSHERYQFCIQYAIAQAT